MMTISDERDTNVVLDLKSGLFQHFSVLRWLGRHQSRESSIFFFDVNRITLWSGEACFMRKRVHSRTLYSWRRSCASCVYFLYVVLVWHPTETTQMISRECNCNRERTRSQNDQNVPSWVEKWSLPQGDTDTTRNNVRLKGNDNNFSFPPFYPHVSWLYCILRRLYVVSVFVLNCTRLLSCLPSDSEQMRSILCVSSKNVNQNLSAFTCMNNVNMRGRNERQDRERSRLSSSSSSSLPLFPFLSDFAHRFSIIIQSTWPVNIISQNDQST